MISVLIAACSSLSLTKAQCGGQSSVFYEAVPLWLRA